MAAVVAEATAGDPAVAARGVVHRYGERTALAGVDFRIERGEIFGFLGPNGGGKTTLFRILATLLPVQQGTVTVLEADVARRPAAARRLIGVVFQSSSIDKLLTVRENLILQGRLYGLSGSDLARRASGYLERFGLTARARDRAGVLSGGQQRRVEIAKALLHEPPVLLLDEPSSGLDPGARREFWETLETLARDSGVTVLLTTHFIEEGDRCDRVALLDGGRIVACDAPSALKAEIGGDVVAIVTRQPEELRVEIGERLGLDATVSPGGELRLESVSGGALVARLAEAFVGRIESISVARPTLEDVFRRRTGRGL